MNFIIFYITFLTLQFQFIIDGMGPLHIGLYSTLCASGPLNKGRSLEWGLREERGRDKGGIDKSGRVKSWLDKKGRVERWIDKKGSVKGGIDKRGGLRLG